MTDQEVHDIIVIGASAGGVEAVKLLVSELPPDFGAAVFVVIHFPPTSVSVLPEILKRGSSLPVSTATDGEAIRAGRIYVAQPDAHLLVQSGVMRVYRGPKENHTRPAIDPLFRSAARAYGPRVIGVLLSGMLTDGTGGLLEIKARGGLAVVQAPDDALFADMPRNAIKNVDVDYVASSPQIAARLTELASPYTVAVRPISPAALDRPAAPQQNLSAQTTRDVEGGEPVGRGQGQGAQDANGQSGAAQNGIALNSSARQDNPPKGSAQEGTLMADDTPYDDHANAVVNHTTFAQLHGERDEQPSIYSCPDCGGVLWQMNEQGFIRFRCHVGHAYSAESLLQQQAEQLEASMWYAVRTLVDKSKLSRQLAQRARDRNHDLTALRFEEQAQAATQHADVIRRLIENGAGDKFPPALEAEAMEPVLADTPQAHTVANHQPRA